MLVQRRGYGHVEPKPQCPLTLLLLLGKGQRALLRECLWSVYHAWGELPGVKLVSDGSLSDAELLELTDWWPGKIQAEQWQVSAEAHGARGRLLLRDFARKNIFGKKLSAVLASGEAGPTMYCDTDILWFAGPPPLPADSGISGAIVKTAADYRRSYDEELVKRAGMTALEARPWYNARISYVRGPVYEVCGIEKLLEIIGTDDDYFSEQTIMAYCCRMLGDAHWTGEEIALNLDDMYWPLRPLYLRRDWYARHYVGEVRHWFWRDALWMRRHGAPARVRRS